MPDPLSPAQAEIDALVSNPAASILVRLAKSAIPETLDKIELADLTECDFPGYAAVAVNQVEYEETVDAEIAVARPEDAVFTAGVIVAPQLVTACYVTTQLPGEPAVLANIDVFECPLVVSDEGQQIKRSIQFVGMAY